LGGVVLPAVPPASVIWAVTPFGGVRPLRLRANLRRFWLWCARGRWLGSGCLGVGLGGLARRVGFWVVCVRAWAFGWLWAAGLLVKLACLARQVNCQVFCGWFGVCPRSGAFFWSGCGCPQVGVPGWYFQKSGCGCPQA